jgi:hypothetical protein
LFPQTVLRLTFNLRQTTSPSTVSAKKERKKKVDDASSKNVSHLEGDRTSNMHERAGKVQLNDDPSVKRDGRVFNDRGLREISET